MTWNNVRLEAREKFGVRSWWENHSKSGALFKKAKKALLRSLDFIFQLERRNEIATADFIMDDACTIITRLSLFLSQLVMNDLNAIIWNGDVVI